MLCFDDEKRKEKSVICRKVVMSIDLCSIDPLLLFLLLILLLDFFF